MYNLTSHEMYTARYLVLNYFLIVIPTDLNLTDFGNAIQRQYGDIISGYSSFSNTLNLTMETWAQTGYNYIEVDGNGIVSKWEYNFGSTKIVAEFENIGYIVPNSSIPYGFEFIFFAGICVIGLVIIVRRRTIVLKNKN